VSDPAHETAARERAIRAWCLYDWANSAFATSALTAILPSYFAQIAGRALPPHLATAYWAYATAGGLAIAAVGGPLLGAAADHLGRRKPLMWGLVLVGCAATALIGMLGGTDWKPLLLLFTLAFVAFACANVLYDSFLPTVAGPHEAHRVSARGFAYGYLGGGLVLAANLAWIVAPARFGLPGPDAAVRLSLVSVALWWLGFSLPFFRSVPDTRGPHTKEGRGGLPAAVLGRLAATLRGVRQQGELFRFLLAFWLYSDGIGTIIKMATIYGTELGIGRAHLMGALLMVQLVAAPASLGFGHLARRVGARPALVAGLAGYALISVFAYFLSRAWHFWALAAMVALVQGGTQALSRSLFASLVPRGREAEMFGFYSVSEKFAGIGGPLLFGLVAQAVGSSRLAVLSLVPMFAGGAWLLARVRLPEPSSATR
jgi:UMF1 family MFS transporter